MIGFYLLWHFLGFRILGHAPQDVVGFLTLVCLILFLGGMQLLALGIIGEYLRILVYETKRRPVAIVEDRAGLPTQAVRNDLILEVDPVPPSKIQN